MHLPGTFQHAPGEERWTGTLCLLVTDLACRAPVQRVIAEYSGGCAGLDWQLFRLCAVAPLPARRRGCNFRSNRTGLLVRLCTPIHRSMSSMLYSSTAGTASVCARW